MTLRLRSDDESFLEHFFADADALGKPKLDPNLLLHFDLNFEQLSFSRLQFLSLDSRLGNPMSLQILALTSSDRSKKETIMAHDFV